MQTKSFFIILTFFILKTSLAQELFDFENYNRTFKKVENFLSEVADSTFVYLGEEDYHVKHTITFSSNNDTLIYSTNYFDYPEPFIEQFRIGFSDIENISVDENEYSDSRVHMAISTKNNKINFTKQESNDPVSIYYVNSFQIPLIHDIDQKKLKKLQKNILVLKKQLAPFKPKADFTKIKTARIHVKEAVLQNLNFAKPDIDRIEKLSQNSKLFVSKCQICLGVQDAIKEYLKHSKDEDVILTLFDKDNDDELYQELQVFVNQSISYYLSHPNLNDEEIDIITDLITKERKNSMNNFKITSCAACDGACKIE